MKTNVFTQESIYLSRDNKADLKGSKPKDGYYNLDTIGTTTLYYQHVRYFGHTVSLTITNARTLIVNVGCQSYSETEVNQVLGYLKDPNKVIKVNALVPKGVTNKSNPIIKVNVVDQTELHYITDKLKVYSKSDFDLKEVEIPLNSKVKVDRNNLSFRGYDICRDTETAKEELKDLLQYYVEVGKKFKSLKSSKK